MEGFQAFLDRHWLDLAIGGLWQALLVLVMWRWNRAHVNTVGIVVLALLPVTLLLLKEVDQATEAQRQTRAELAASRLFNEQGALLAQIELTHPSLKSRAMDLVTETNGHLRGMARGEEPILSESQYFDVLSAELKATPNGGTIHDVVMPLNPKRVGDNGVLPLKKYIEEIATSVRERKIKYNLYALPAQQAENEVREAFERFNKIDVTVYVVDRDQLDRHLLDTNFSLYPDRKTVCHANRDDSARIMNGIRIQENASAYDTWSKKLDEITKYSVRYIPQGSPRN